MGEEIKVTAVEVENDGTLIQIDCSKGRLFVEVADIFIALNNYAYRKHDQECIKIGMEKIDSDAPNPNELARIKPNDTPTR